jgi:uncharacterized SAM-binding protein YcdF (DUF218 family)
MSLQNQPRPRFSILRLVVWGVSWLALPVIIIALAYLFAGRSVCEKAATAMFLPTGLLFWFPLTCGVKLLRRGQVHAAAIPIFIGLFSYVVSNPIVSVTILKSLERTYPLIEFENTQPFDAIVVLGGGTSAGPDRRAHLNGAGDRVSFACRLYHLKLVKKILVTGDALRGTASDDYLDPSMQAKKILIESGVSASDIEEINGTTTFEEMRSLKARQETITGKRYGLVTSAFHMPRAMRLARTNGLDLVPIATDFRTSDVPISFLDWIPSHVAFSGVELSLREYLGTLVGR